jgi:hypothetical protein
MKQQERLSLTVIVGNAEQYIGRFLDSFMPLVDETVVVRAIGAQDPDRTLDVAKERGCIVGEYLNADGNQWPHVDNFAAARNKAASLATGDWLMWADTDDVSRIDSENLRLMLTHLSPDIDGVLMPYEVPDDGITLHRERIWRRGKAEWKGAVHECLKFHSAEAQMARFDQMSVLHLPSGPRSKTSDERNMRILQSIPQIDRTPAHLFYLMQSQRSAGQIREAIQTAEELAMHPDAPKPERYEAFLMMGQVISDPSERAQLYLQAIAVDPGRREAYGELALHCYSVGQPEDALAWVQTMSGIQKPQAWQWNARKKFYGWLGVQLHAMMLRANARSDEANALEINHFIRNGAKISLLHATRGRAKEGWRARQTWLERAQNADGIEHIFATDQDDPMSFAFQHCRGVRLDGKGGPVAAWNRAAEACNGEVMIQVSDDWMPPMHWDRLILDAIGDTSKPAVLAISDGSRKDDLLCMAILTRARYKQQGYLFNPEFFSMYSDNWFSHCAFHDGVAIDARDHIVFEHLHPAFGKAQMDETYARSNDDHHYQQGKATFEKLIKESQ